MNDLLRTLLYGAKVCPGCGGHNFRGQTYCSHCGERIRNRNPIIRLFVTLLAVAVVAGVVWFKLKW
jgi:predicted nucleic acid-binding Zn ribbon protein